MNKPEKNSFKESKKKGYHIMANTKLIRNATVLTMDPKIGDVFNCDILIVEDRITEVRPNISVEGAEIIDGSSHIVLPGFIDTHRHVWQAALRNLGSDWTLGHYFTGIHFGLSTLYRPEDTYAGNLLGTLEALDSGITTLLDWSHNLETPDHGDAAVQALFDSGSRVVFAHGGGGSMWQAPSSIPHTRDALRIKDKYFSSDDQLVTMAFAARGPQFTTPEVTISDWALARELGTRITVHVGDGEWGKTRPIEWMRANNLLADDITYVHCNTLADDELQMIADSGGTASVSADIETQMGHGWPATGRLLDVGIRPSLSIDVCVSNGGNMFNAMKTTISVQRAMDNGALERASDQESLRLSCRDVLEFATIEGARAVGLDHLIGSITPGKKADLIFVRTDNLAMRPENNPVGAIVYNAHPGLVDTVLVSGKVVKSGGLLVGVDISSVIDRAENSRDYLMQVAADHAPVKDARIGGTWFPEVTRASK